MIGTLSMEDLARIRRMSRTDAEAFISEQKLTFEERERVLSLAGKSISEGSTPRGMTYDVSRRQWFLAAWLAGASWRQLAYLHGLAPQTIISSVDRIMTSPERQRRRLATKLSPELLSGMRAHFIKNINHYSSMEPTAIAEDLIAQTKDTL